MQKLVDGDVAINHWQWQMQAGVTNPLSDTFRIYNPTTNLKERDSKLQYIHEWLPEYADCQTVDDVLNQAQPIVDWRSGEHEKGLLADAIVEQVEETVVARGVASPGLVRLAARIPEVVGLVDDDSIGKLRDTHEALGEIALTVEVGVAEDGEVAEVRVAAHAADMR